MRLSTLGPAEALAALELASLEALWDVDRAREHPAYLLDRISHVIDEKTGEKFGFHLTEPDHAWFWQRRVLDELLAHNKSIVLKARQIGITWLACGLGLWIALYQPGTRILIYRQKEDDAAKLVGRMWDMFNGLPDHLRANVRVLKPVKGRRPNLVIEFEHPNGAVSTIEGMASTESAGHGDTAALVILDEAARIDRLRAIWKAVVPTVGTKARIIAISTGNGVSVVDEKTDESFGNYFHRLWVTAKLKKIHPIFLSWETHPDRDQAWFEDSEEVASLDARERKEQYPANEHEAFALPHDVWYDQEALDFYASERVEQSFESFDFVHGSSARAAKRLVSPEGLIDLFRVPRAGQSYAIAADIATGNAYDYSAAYVIDLSNMELCAELHGRIPEDRLAYQLWFLGHWFNEALICPEIGGGYGQAVIVALRDGVEGRPAYKRLYRHRMETRINKPVQERFGFPITSQTRPLIINQLGKALFERTLPFVTPSLMSELSTFIRHKVNPSPRAQEGCNDDCVMAAALALEMFREFGEHPEKQRTKSRARHHHFLKLGNEDVQTTTFMGGSLDDSPWS